MSTKNTKLKAQAAPSIPQTRDDCASRIALIGRLQRSLAREEAAMNDRIAEITADAQPKLDFLKAEIEQQRSSVQTWCEANRAELTSDGKTKTANLVTGEIAWRQRPPSCLVRGADAVIETLRRMGLQRFLRTKEEVNREAVLADPEAVRGIAGLSIQTGVEDFIVTPFEQAAS